VLNISNRTPSPVNDVTPAARIAETGRSDYRADQMVHFSRDTRREQRGHGDESAARGEPLIATGSRPCRPGAPGYGRSVPNGRRTRDDTPCSAVETPNTHRDRLFEEELV
jgi:hypothetical protein